MQEVITFTCSSQTYVFGEQARAISRNKLGIPKLETHAIIPANGICGVYQRMGL